MTFTRQVYFLPPLFLLPCNHKSRTLTTQDPSVVTIPISGVRLVQVDYNDKEALTIRLNGIDTVLSFILESDPSSPATKNLIDACIAAGVQRFGANEWAAYHSLPKI